jgi:two-component system response regulator MprA
VRRHDPALRPLRTDPAAPPVLVVDDDPSILAMLCDVLEDEGYRVIGARDGMEALAVLERETPFLVLLDVLMPLFDGRSFATVARQQGYRMPIVVVTAIEATSSWREIGADGCIAKPFDLDELLVTVTRFRDVARAGTRASAFPLGG